MGLFDLLLNPIALQGQAVAQQVNATQPTTSSGVSYVSTPSPATESAGVSRTPSGNNGFLGSVQSEATNIWNTGVAYVTPAIQQVSRATEVAIANPGIVAPIIPGGVAIAGAALVANTFFVQPKPVEAISPATLGRNQGGPDFTYITNPEVLTPTKITAPVQSSFQTEALRTVSERAGYTNPATLGDARTQAIVNALKNPVFEQMGIRIESRTALTGQILEAQRGAATTTKAQQFFGNELQKWAENKVELGEAYHEVGVKANAPIPANPFEYSQDLAVEFLKGAPTKSSEMFSPVSGEMSKNLPSGQGLQQYQWNVALATDRGTAQPRQVSFMKGVEYLNAAENLYGPYGKLAGGVDTGGVMAVTPGIGGAPAGVTLSGSTANVKGYTIQPTVDLQNLPMPFKSTVSGAEPYVSPSAQNQTGALPFFGVVPYVSDVVKMFEPQELTNPRTGEVTYGQTPANISISSFLPDPKSAAGESLTSKVQYAIEMTPGVGLATLQFDVMGRVADAIAPAAIKTEKWYTEGREATGFIPMTPQYIKDTYTVFKEDPTRGLINAGLTVAVVGAGTALRVAGAGETFLVAGSRGQQVYSTVSTLGTGVLGVAYANQQVKAITGSSLAEIEHAALYSGEGGYGGSLSAVSKQLTENYPGMEKSRLATNAMLTQDIIPVAAAYGGSMFISDKIADIAQTRGTPEIPVSQARTFAYLSEEGYPSNQNIKTKDLADSFQAGTITMERASDLAKTKMQPSGEPISRIPVGTRIGVEPGKAYIYSGAETQYLRAGGMVGESSSEVTQAAYFSPQGLAYFTKPGQGFGISFGISSDVLGLYRQPTLFRGIVSEKNLPDFSTGKGIIPENILKTPTGEVHTGINDPLNPRNIAIDQYLVKHGKFGQVYAGQYGKSEWQGLIRTGTEVKSAERVGYFTSEGRRVRVVDVEFGTKAAKGYQPRTQFEMEKFYVESPAARSSKVSESSTPAVAVAVPKSGPSERSSGLSEFGSYPHTPEGAISETPSRSRPGSSKPYSEEPGFSSMVESYGKSSGRSYGKSSAISEGEPYEASELSKYPSEPGSSGKSEPSSISDFLSYPGSSKPPSGSKEPETYGYTPPYTPSSPGPSEPSPSKSNPPSSPPPLGGLIGPGGISGGGGRPRGYASFKQTNPVGADLLRTGSNAPGLFKGSSNQPLKTAKLKMPKF